MAGNAIDFEKVDAPAGVEFGDGVVVGLRGGRTCLQPVVERIPGTRIRDVCGGLCVIRSAGNRQVFAHSLFGNSAQNVNAEFEAERMDVISQWLEAGAV